MSCFKVTWQITVTLDSDKKKLLWPIKHKCYRADFEAQGIRGGRGKERQHAKDSWQWCQMRMFGFWNVRRVGRPLEANVCWLKHPLGCPQFRCALTGCFHTRYAHSRTQQSCGWENTNHLHVGKKDLGHEQISFSQFLTFPRAAPTLLATVSFYLKQLQKSSWKVYKDD